MIAQTFTAQPETFIEALIPVLTILSLAWGGLQTIKASNKAALLRAAIIGVKAGLDSLNNPADREIVKQQIERAAGGREAPLNQDLKAEVRKTTSTLVAYREDGLPRLGLLLAVSILLGAGGCVSAAVHDSAVVALEASGVLRRASVPNPGYKTPEEVEAWERLWAKQDAALRAISEETR